MKFVAVGIIEAMKLDTSPEYCWFKDTKFLEQKNKFIPEKLELPLFLQKKIRFQKDEDLNKKFQKHCSTYGYKFRSLTTVARPVLDCSKPPKTNPDICKETFKKAKDDRSLNINFRWSLPPNIYSIKSHMDESRDHQMGKKGIYNCFTVPRTPETIIGRHALKYFNGCKTEFYDLPKEMDLPPTSDYKFKFNWSDRFKKKKVKEDKFEMRNDDGTKDESKDKEDKEKEEEKSSPGPTDYCPLDREVKFEKKPPPKRKQPLFYYPSTTVPVIESSYAKIKFFSPGPNRYNLDEKACPCSRNFIKAQALLDSNEREIDFKCDCGKIRDISGHGHGYIFNSKTMRLVERSKSAYKCNFKDKIPNFPIEPPVLTNRVPVHLRNADNILDEVSIRPVKLKEIRFDSIVVRQQKFSVKSGRPVAFMCAEPRFDDNTEIVPMARRRKSITLKKVSSDPSKKKKFSVKRLLELSKHRINPNCPIPDIYADKIRLYKRLNFNDLRKDQLFQKLEIPWTLSDDLHSEDQPSKIFTEESFFREADLLSFNGNDGDGNSTTSSVMIEQLITTRDLELI